MRICHLVTLLMLLNKKYNKLLPTESFLTDEVILLNAWKKSHQHIRGINWYVDCLDLDKSVLELDYRVSELSSSLKSKDLSLTPLKLIPAPKSHPLQFKKLPKDDHFNLGDSSLLWFSKKLKN